MDIHHVAFLIQIIGWFVVEFWAGVALLGFVGFFGVDRRRPTGLNLEVYAMRPDRFDHDEDIAA